MFGEERAAQKSLGREVEKGSGSACRIQYADASEIGVVADGGESFVN